MIVFFFEIEGSGLTLVSTPARGVFQHCWHADVPGFLVGPIRVSCWVLACFYLCFFLFGQRLQ